MLLKRTFSAILWSAMACVVFTTVSSGWAAESGESGDKAANTKVIEEGIEPTSVAVEVVVDNEAEFQTPDKKSSTEQPVEVTSRGTESGETVETSGTEDEMPAAQDTSADEDNKEAKPAKPAEVEDDVEPVETPLTTATEEGKATGDDKSAPVPADDKKKDDKKDSVEFSEKTKNEEKNSSDNEVYLEPPEGNGVIEGFAGWKHHNRVPKEAIDTETILPIPDRWRLGMHPNTQRARGNPWNPYRQNMLKGDYPIVGQSIFMTVVAASDTTVEGHSVPTASNVSSERSGSREFFGRPDQFVLNQNFVVSVELFKGETDFKPREWEVRFTPVFNLNYVDVQERFVVNLDPRRGSDRLDHQIAFQELFGEYHFRDISPSYDFLSSRTGIQHYNQDFRGFLFDDFQPTLRVFGQYEANRLQFNLAGVEMLTKDTNSGLNSLFEFKDEHVVMANLVRQDTFIKGYSMSANVGFSDEESSVDYNQNGVIVRPAPIGDLKPHSVKAGYVGFGGDGHIGRLNVSHQFYQAFGVDSHNPLAGKRTTINAQMAALEMSVDYDWMRFRTSAFYASGDASPTDGIAGGFDAIYDNPNFAGGQFSYWVRQGFGAGNSATSLKSRSSLLPNMATSKDEGQSNFVNPGVQILNFAYDAEITTRLKATLNYNYIRFSDTSSLETLLQQDGISRNLGHDYGMGITYRPWLNQQVVLTGGVAGFTPAEGYKDVYSTSQTQYSGFLNILVRY